MRAFLERSSFFCFSFFYLITWASYLELGTARGFQNITKTFCQLELHHECADKHMDNLFTFFKICSRDRNIRTNSKCNWSLSLPLTDLITIGTDTIATITNTTFPSLDWLIFYSFIFLSFSFFTFYSFKKKKIILFYFFVHSRSCLG